MFHNIVITPVGEIKIAFRPVQRGIARPPMASHLGAKYKMHNQKSKIVNCYGLMSQSLYQPGFYHPGGICPISTLKREIGKKSTRTRLKRAERSHA
jgi:hypothetical protein